MNQEYDAWVRLARLARQAAPDAESRMPMGFAARVLARRSLGRSDVYVAFELLAVRTAVAALLMAGTALLAWPSSAADDGDLPIIAMTDIVP